MMRLVVRRKAFPAVGRAPERIVFNDFALSLRQGEVCVLVGPSGVGKSTLLNIAAGLDRAFAGEREVPEGPIGYVFQNARLLPWLTARRNIEVVLPEMAREPRHAEASRWLEAIGLAEAGEVHPARLSVGMARRVAVARALAVAPRLLLLDEPFAALDAANARGIAELVRAEITARRPTTLIVTHDLAEVPFADRVVSLAGAPARIVGDARRDAADGEDKRMEEAAE